MVEYKRQICLLEKYFGIYTEVSIGLDLIEMLKCSTPLIIGCF